MREPVAFRVISFLAGLVLVILGSTPAKTRVPLWFILLMALPFLAGPLLPRKSAVVFGASFALGYATILAGALWLLTIVSLPFSFERIGATAGPMAFVASFVWISSLVALLGTPPGERGAIPGGIILGMLYFPVVYFGGLEYGRTKTMNATKPHDLFRPVACALEYHTSRGEWPQTWSPISQVAGCGPLAGNMIYERTSSGFLIRTTGAQPGYYSDESGVVRRADTKDRYEQITNSEPASFGRVLFQLEEYRRKKGDYPESLEAVVAFAPAMKGIGDDNHYLFSYEREAPDRFTLTAQPSDYGVTGLRSFYTDQTHVVHGTALNRKASPDDPVAPLEEIRDLTPRN